VSNYSFLWVKFRSVVALQGPPVNTLGKHPVKHAPEAAPGQTEQCRLAGEAAGNQSRNMAPGVHFKRLTDAATVVNPHFTEESFKFSPNQAGGIECDFSQLTRCQVSPATSTLQRCGGLIYRQRRPRTEFRKTTNQYYIRALSTFADTGGSPPGRMYSVAVVVFLLANCGTLIKPIRERRSNLARISAG
jgi:hypothetical protein